MIEGFYRTKRIGILLSIILAAVLLTGLTGCVSTTDTAPANTAPDDPAVDTTSSVVPEQPSDSTAGTVAPSSSSSTKQDEADKPSDNVQNDSGSESPSSSAGAQEGYYGQWSVARVLAYGDAGTYSKEDAEKLVGRNLSFSADEAGIFNDQPSDAATVIKKPGYQEDVISRNDFLMNFRMNFDTLGIDADSVTEVTVSGPDVSGCTLLIKDGDTMIMSAGRTYFELVRVK